MTKRVASGEIRVQASLLDWFGFDLIETMQSSCEYSNLSGECLARN